MTESTNRRRAVRQRTTCLGLVAVLLLTAFVTAAPQPASAATFTVQGSLRQVATWGHAAGTTVELLDPAGNVAGTGTADAKGAKLFRDLDPATGYRVRAGGTTSSAVTVLDPEVAPPQSSYDGITINEGFGYIPTRDGTTLSANVTFPKNGNPGPWPVLVDYSGYDPSQPGQTPSEAQIYAYFGYVVVGVNMRGTTCSGGAFWYFEDAQRTDGYDVIEALAHQPWANGDVGMVGISYSGYSQIPVAGTRPPHLRAITPLSPYSDTYRGILYPGGVLNNGFALGWALDRQEASAPAAHSWVRSRINGGDTTCAANQTLRLQSQDLATEIRPGRFADQRYAYLDTSTFEPRIDVPVFLATQWQDEQTGGYGAELATRLATHTKVRFEVTNGTHVDSLGPEVFLRVAEFIDFYVGKRLPRDEGNLLYRDGIASGLQSLFGTTITLPPARFLGYTDYAAALAAYEAEKPVRIRWENGAVPGKEGGPYAPLASTHAAWPIPGTTAQRWFLRPDGGLNTTASTVPDDQARGWSTYTYDPDAKREQTFTGSTGAMWLSHPDVHWDAPPEGKSLTFTTPVFANKRAYAGNGSVDLWVRSSAADTDFEVSLTEVRPDGKEVSIQSGWLRASRRALDTAGSTELRPRQTFQEGDAAPLPSGQFVPVRIELFPFAHIVRPGSRLRLNIEAPGGNQPFWAFDALPGSATNDIAHSAGRPSSVVLPLLNDGQVLFWSPTAAPSCAVSGVTTQSQTLRNQPCRDDRPARVPTNVAATVSGAKATVSWTAPPAWPGGTAPTAYRVTSEPSGATVEVAGTATTAQVGGLTAGGATAFRVAARFGTTLGPASDASPPVTIPAPGTPSGNPGDASVALSWAAPASAGSPVTGYVVIPAIDGVAQAPRTFASTATTQAITGLANGTPHTFTVAATYTNGTGAPSAPSAPLTPGAPGVPVLVSAKPGNASATVGWWPPATNGSTVTGSVVTPYLDGVAQPARTFSGAGTSQVVTGLTNGGSYTFTVSVQNARGTSPTSKASPATVVGAPGQPVLVNAAPGNSAATVSWWNTPNGSPITSAVVTPYAGTTALPARTFSSGAGNQVVTGLDNGTAYTFKVVVRNTYGESTLSPASPPVVVGTPSAPVLQKATALPGGAKVQWWPPANNGSPVTGFVITPFQGTTALPARTFTSTLNTQTVTGLSPGVAYTFRIAAVNARGTGAQSGATNAATPT